MRFSNSVIHTDSSDNQFSNFILFQVRRLRVSLYAPITQAFTSPQFNTQRISLKRNQAMKTILQFLGMLTTLLLVQVASASDCTGSGYCSQRVVTSLVVNYYDIYLKVEGDVSFSCSSFGREFRLPLTNTDGTENAHRQAMYAALLSYVGQRKKVDMWFTDTATELQETNETNGCSGSALAEINGISASFSTTEYPADELIEDEERGIPPIVE